MLRFKQEGNSSSIELIGNLDSSSAAQIEKVLQRFTRSLVVLDFSHLQELDEEGLRPLLLASKRLRLAGGDLCITNIPTKIKAFLENEGYGFVLTLEKE